MKPNINEATINKADINAIFKDATAMRNRYGVGRFLGLAKDKIKVEDLQQAWAKGLDPKGRDAYSDDTRDIKRILQKFGFGDKEINKIFAQVFKTDDSGEYDDERDAPGASAEVQKVANFAKKHDLTDALISFLEGEFGKELGIKQKAMFEEVRQIFMAIVKEERTERARLIKEEERTLLGRTRK
ncbi:MAG TPA: hypothetical protein VIY47_02830 [Ignavibacteriaceae bacterium]